MERNGAAVYEVLKITEYSSWGEFLRESDEIERRLTLGAIRQFHEERSPE